MENMLRLYDCGAKLLLRFKPSQNPAMLNLYLEVYVDRRHFYRQTTKLSWYKNNIYQHRIQPRSLNDQEFSVIEKKLAEKIKEWDDILSKMSPIVVDKFKESLENPPKKIVEKLSFYEFTEQYILNITKKSTKSIYNSILNTIKKYYPDGSWFFWCRLDASDLAKYFSGRTLKNKINFVKIIFHNALHKGILLQNPIFFRTIPKITIPKVVFSAKTSDYDRAFEIWQNSNSPKKRKSLAKLLFAALTGLRWVDVNSISPDNIKDGRLILSITKTKDSTGAIANLQLSAKALQLIDSLKPKEVVIEKSKTKEQDIKAIRYDWYYPKKQGDYYNLKFFDLGFKAKFHDSRRFVATEISRKTGGDIFKIAKLLCITPNIAQRYVHMDSSDVDKLTSEGFF